MLGNVLRSIGILHHVHFQEVGLMQIPVECVDGMSLDES